MLSYKPIQENIQFKNRIHDNATFDQTAVLYAVRNGLGEYWHKVDNGFCQADSIGGNQWIPKENGTHSYLVLDMPKEKMEEEIERFMMGDF